MANQALAQKIIVLGVDGMDPRLTKKFVDEGVMPNVKKYIEQGSARKDLSFIGAVPTITPPMWTTLATGAYPMTHGITCFWNQHPSKLDTLVYALDSRSCQAEQLWNVFADDYQMKTLVWHWPGSSWPPSSQSENLHVVDGTQPAIINWGVGIIDWEKLVVASTEIKEVIYKPKAGNDTGAGCILSDVNAADELSTSMVDNLDTNNKESKNIMMSHEDGDLAIDAVPFDIVNSPIKSAEKWANAPEHALEFTIVTSSGLVRRPALLLQNKQGIYDTIAIYKSKKDLDPMITMQNDGNIVHIFDDIIVDDAHKIANRAVKVLEIAPDGSKVKIWMSCALDTTNDSVWHPKRLYKDVTENIGFVPPGSLTGGKDPELVKGIVLPSWDTYVDWQSAAIMHLIDKEEYRMVFSHVHNVDAMGHFFWHFAKDREDFHVDEAVYQGFIRDVYRQTDRYLGAFLPLLDEGWTVLITSDHGLVCSWEEHVPLIGDPFGVNVKMMQELGYTKLLTDENGQEMKEIDWSQTKAIATRGNYIYLNLKGKYETGIVDPEDQFALEGEIISALYNYRLDGKRVINIALRAKDAVVMGLGGERCGDIMYWLEDGFNRVHGDSLSTCEGYADTSVAPIFIGAGSGIKAGYTIKRMIRQVDFAPTMAVLAGVRMPAECEGAPMYQIFSK